MKKILKTVMLLMILIFGLQLYVQADMGAPMIKPYKARVINPDGVDCYNYEGDLVISLEYGDEIEISYEYPVSEDGELYASFELDTDTYTLATVNLKDIAPVDEMYVAKNLDFDNPKNKVVVSEEGAELYNGPSLAYDKMNVNLPIGTEIVVYSEKESYDNPWYYTTYEGNSGWVCELDTLGTYIEDKKVFVEETEFYEFKTGGEVPKKIGTIPAKTIIKNYIRLDPWRQSYYVKYNGQWGTVSDRDAMFERDEIAIYTSDEELKIYDKYVDSFMFENPNDYDLDNIKVLGTIPKNTKIAQKYEYYTGNSAYISYNGIEGCIITPYFDDVEFVQTTDLELPTFEDFTVIEVPKLTAEDNVTGDEGNAVEENEEEQLITIQVTPEQIVLFAVVIAVVVSLTCVVTIVLINKTSKKNNKKEEVKEENK